MLYKKTKMEEHTYKRCGVLKLLVDWKEKKGLGNPESPLAWEIGEKEI